MICRENVWSVSDSLSLLFTRKTRKMKKYFSGGEKRRPAIRLCPLAITRESTVQLTVTWNKLASAHSKCLFDRPLLRSPGILTNKAATKWLRPYSYSKTGVCLLLSYRQVNVLCSASLESVVKKSFLFTRAATIDFGSFSVSIWQMSRTDNTLNNAELKYLVYWQGGVEGCYFMLIQGISTRKYAYRSHFPQHLPGVNY